MRRPLLGLLAAFLAGCTSDPDPVPGDELSTESFRRVQVRFWSDPAGSGSAHVAHRTCADGSTVSREHLVSFDPLEADEPAWWADITIQVAKDATASRLYVELGRGTELASAPRALSLARLAGGRWARIRADGSAEELAQFDGCSEFEVAGDHVSPGLPCGRLRLADGESADVEVLLVSLPSLDLSRARRRVSRIDALTWTVETPGPEGVPGTRVELRFGEAGALSEILGPDGRRHVLRDVTLE